jgi:hypothetical protein
MKPISFRLGVILSVIGLFIFGYVKLWGADWRFYGKNDLGSYYYDTTSLTRPSENMVRISVKNVLTQEGVRAWVKRFGSSFHFRDLSYIISQREFNCADNKSRWLTTIFYSNEGNTLRSTSGGASSEWDFIPSESVDGILYKQICK